MTNQFNALPITDRSGFAPVIGSAVSMLVMIALVAASAVHMMM